jgi:hypothetical protein
MAFRELPAFAAWRHEGARDGFEVVFMRSGPDGHRVEGHTAAVEEGEAWAVSYSIVAAADWTARSARVVGSSAAGRRELALEGDGAGAWRVDGAAAPQLAGCLDVDLESSAFTNTFPVHRLALGAGDAAAAPAVYVRAAHLGVERLEQRYERVAGTTFEYAAPRFGYAGRLDYDEHGLVMTYPGLAVRAA